MGANRLAALMSEAGVILVLLAAIAGYTVFTPSITDAQSATLGEDIGTTWRRRQAR